MARPEQFTAAQVAQALTDAQGLARYAAQRLGCTEQTIYSYMKKYPTVKAARDAARESQIDYVESKLLEQIKDGNITAIIFYLKTQAKHRRYTERTELTGKGGDNLEVIIKYANGDD